MKLSALINRFLNHYRQDRKSTSTLSSYSTDLKQFSAVLRENDISNLTRSDTRDATRRWVSTFSTNSQARKLSTVKTFLRWCYRQGFIHGDLSKHITLPKRHAVHPVHPLSPVQISRLRREATPLERVLLELILQTGMRLRDVVAIHSKHVSSRMLIIPSSRLKLPLAEPLQKALARYQLIRPATERTAMLANEHGRSVSIRTATTILKNLARRAGVRNATARALRQTFIVRQIDAGVPLSAIQKIVGLQSLASLSSYIRLASPDAHTSITTVAGI